MSPAAIMFDRSEQLHPSSLTHIKIYDSQPRSYRDLPVRLSEFGTVYRWEQSGELNGLTRVRSFTVDDAHLFVRPDQVEAEVAGCLKLVKLAFDTLGLR